MNARTLTLGDADLDLGRDETITVTFHRKTRKWWAVIGNIDQGKLRATAEADSPIAALAEALADLGVGQVDRLDS